MTPLQMAHECAQAAAQGCGAVLVVPKGGMPLRAKAPPPRQAKQIEYTPTPRPVVRPAGVLPMSSPPMPKDAPVRDGAYRRLVAALPCINCGRWYRSQAAHGPALGKGIKASDRDLFPLCADEPGAIGCHTKFDRYILFPREQRREVAARWAAETRETIERMHGAQLKVIA